MNDLTQTSSVHKSIYLTRRGNFIPKVEEIYLRRDIPCGYNDCILCLKKLDFFNFESTISEPNPMALNIEQTKETVSQNLVLVLDIAGLINSLDCLLSSNLFPHQVIPHSVLDWLQRTSRSAFKKLKTFLELDNHGQMRVFPDKFSADLSEIRLEFPPEQKHLLSGPALRSLESCAKMAAYFSSHLSFLENVQVVLLSDNKRLRILEQVKSLSSTLAKVEICNLSEYLRMFVQDQQTIRTVLDCVPASVADIDQQLREHAQLISSQEEVDKFMKSHSYLLTKLKNESSKTDLDINLENQQMKEDKKINTELMSRVNEGLLFRGKLRISRNNSEEGTVGCRILGRDVLIKGRDKLGLAIHGDFVAVEIFPVSEWVPLEEADLRLEDETQEGFSKPALESEINQGNTRRWLISRLDAADPPPPQSSPDRARFRRFETRFA